VLPCEQEASDLLVRGDAARDGATVARLKKSMDSRALRRTASPGEFAERVYAAVRAIPHGHVASYGGVAAVMGVPRAARAVGTALCALADESDVPWWRVVNRNGEISIKCTIHGPALQRALLEGEGVTFNASGRIDWNRFGWDGTGVPAGVREDRSLDRDGDGCAGRAGRVRAPRRGR